MDTTIWPAFDNTTGVMLFLPNSSDGYGLQTVASSAPQMSSPTQKFVYSLTIAVTVIGVCANAVVFAVLMRARRRFGSNVNTLIINQSIMDLLACFFILVQMIFIMTGGFVYNTIRSQLAVNALCILWDAGALVGTCMTGGKLGLVVVTLERYFKVVHAIAHRKYYRDWMTKLGVVLPWINGLCWTLFPSIGTSRVVHGTCQRMAVWPNRSMASVSPQYIAYYVFNFYEIYCVHLQLTGLYCKNSFFDHYFVMTVIC